MKHWCTTTNVRFCNLAVFESDWCANTSNCNPVLRVRCTTARLWLVMFSTMTKTKQNKSKQTFEPDFSQTFSSTEFTTPQQSLHSVVACSQLIIRSTAVTHKKLKRDLDIVHRMFEQEHSSVETRA